MDTAELDYDLPAAAIAQHPVEPRDAARLLVDRGPASPPEHRTVADLDALLDDGDLLVVNETRVVPARLRLRKPTGGAVEVLLLAPVGDGSWEALVKPSRRVPAGTVLAPAAGPDGVEVEVGPVVGDDGRRHVTLRDGGRPADPAVLDRIGEVPLPPYVHATDIDPARYQTVFAVTPGSVAAPTAGLHLTGELLGRCRDRGVTVAGIELQVGLGTFRPIGTDRVEDHVMHGERYRIPAATLDLLRDGDRRVVAVGTTVVRTLETWAATGAAEGESRLFVHGAYPFAVVDRLLTNFHVPRSSLLALIEAFVGPRWRELYAEALARGYRFLSFGDALLLDRAAEGRGA